MNWIERKIMERRYRRAFPDGEMERNPDGSKTAATLRREALLWRGISPEMFRLLWAGSRQAEAEQAAKAGT